MKNILFIEPFLPYPMQSGGHQAVYNGLKVLNNEANLFLIYPEDGNRPNSAEVNELKSLINNLTVLPYVVYYKHNKLLDLIYKIKYEVKKFLTGEVSHKNDSFRYGDWLSQLFPKDEQFIQHINTVIETYHIDIVQSEFLENLFLALTLPTGVKKIFVEHEIGFVRKALKLQEIHDSSSEGKANLLYNQILEVSLLNKFDTIITLSSTDTQKLIDAGVCATIHTSFAIVNTSIVSLPKTNYHHCLSFVGPEWHPSNKAGLLWFLDNCWHSLLRRNPDYQLKVIGIWNQETISILQKKYHNLTFCGFVPSLEVELKDTVMIVPITIGSGIRMKILEASAIGVPVVSTSVGIEGLPFATGKDCEIADTPDQFVKAIVSMDDERKRLSYITNAQKIVTNSFSIDSLKANRIALY